MRTASRSGSRMGRHRRAIGGLGIGLVLWLGTVAVHGAFPALASTGSAAAKPSSPNRFDPTSRAASAAGARVAQPAAAAAGGHGRSPVAGRPAPAAGRPVTIPLDPTGPAHLASADASVDVDVPSGAVSAADVSAAGGAMSLLVRQVVPAGGGSAGGSGHVSFGTYLVQVVDAAGHLARQGLRQPLGVRLHYGADAGVDVGGAVAVVNAPLPPWVALDPAAPAAVRPASGVASRPAGRGLGPMVQQPATVDAGTQTLATTAPAVASSTTVSFATVAPVATFGAPDLTEVNPGAGALTLEQALDLPAGPGGFTPPLSLAYNSAAVSDQHNVAAAASWAGEGWHLSLGAISWAERDVTAGCFDVCAGFTWGDTWQLVDAFGTKAELIAPTTGVSTYYEDGRKTSITASPITWHTAPETHARVISYTGPNALPGMTARPPCFREFLPSGVMEEFGCTPDSLQFFPQPSGAVAGKDFMANWLPDLITDPHGNQIHVTYQVDTATGKNGASYPRDAVMATVEYDSPGCHDAQAACTGAAWAPLMRVSFQASHTVAHVAGSSCPARGALRCDDPIDLSGSRGLAAPLVQNTFVLNDALVQVRSAATAPWSTLRDYQLAFDQSAPVTITDPFSGVVQSTAGRLNLTRLTEIGADGTTAFPARTFGYAKQIQWYEDSAWAPAPASNCGPSWNNGQTFGEGCNLWSQSYEGNSYYLSSMGNGLGLSQSYTWQNARNNTDGVPGTADLLDPFVCNTMQSTSPCDVTDDESWSRIVLSTRTDGLLRQSQAGQGGAQTGTPVTGVTRYGYHMAPVDSYWGDEIDWDVLDFYNWRFMGFATATVTNPDGSVDVHQYPATQGRGVFDPAGAQFRGICTTADPCNSSPWWLAANAEHGREIELDRYNPDGSLVQVTKTQYSLQCPPSGVTGTVAGNLVGELDWGNQVAVCDIAPGQVDQWFVDGGSQAAAPHLTTTFTHDAYGRVTSQTRTTNDGAGAGSPTTIVQRAWYTWNDAVAATATSATGRYQLDLPALVDLEDAGGARFACRYTSYDGQAPVIGQTAGLTRGDVTRSDVYTACGTAANGFAPSGQISTSHTYDASGNPLAGDDPDALAGIASHLGCASGAGTFSVCATFDGTFGTLPTASVNALGQRTATGYQPPAAGGATGGFGLWPTSMTDPNGQVTAFAYDPLGRITGLALPGEAAGSTTLGTAYTVWCAPTGAQAPCVEIDQTQRLDATRTVTTRAFYDGLGRLAETRVPAPGGRDVVRYWFYDQSGRLAFQSVPYFVTAYSGASGAAAYSVPDSTQAGATFTYDALGRTTGVTDALSHRATTRYAMICGAAGTGDAACYRQTLTVDPDGHQAGMLADALGRVAYAQRYTGSTAASYAVYATGRYAYDLAGDLVLVVHPDGVTRTAVAYDMAGRKTAITDADRGAETFAYDPDGNLVQSADARGAEGTVFAGYDGLDRPLWHSPTNGPSGASVTYGYDSPAAGAGAGRLTSETFGNGVLSGSYAFGYDARGRQTQEAMTVGSAAYVVQAGYDDAGDLVTQGYPDGQTVTTSYTPEGWLSGVSSQRGTVTTSLLAGATYTGTRGALGDLSGATLAGGAYAYSASDDLLGRTIDTKLSAAAGSTLFEQARSFDPAGNVSAIGTALPAGTDNQAFCYDEQNRLTWAGSTGTAPCTGAAVAPGTLGAASYTQGFSYDTLGRTVTGPLGSVAYGSAHPHAATAAGVTWTAGYDAAGDMTCRAPSTSTTCAGATPSGARLGYDNEGRLATWQGPGGGTTARFLYDGQGQRVAQQVTQGGVTTTTAYVGRLEAVTSSSAGTTTRAYYRAGDLPIAVATNGTFSFLGSDAQGSTAVALGPGGATTAQLFAPYGAVRYAGGTLPTDYGFTGQRADAVSGLDYFGARYYDPSVGQFTSADTVVPGDGFGLWGLSRYAYTRGNPTTRTDPTGHDDDGGGFGGGDFGGGDFGGGDFGGGDFGGGDFGGGDFGGGDFGGGDFGGGDFGGGDFGAGDFGDGVFGGDDLGIDAAGLAGAAAAMAAAGALDPIGMTTAAAAAAGVAAAAGMTGAADEGREGSDTIAGDDDGEASLMLAADNQTRIPNPNFLFGPGEIIAGGALVMAGEELAAAALVLGFTLTGVGLVALGVGGIIVGSAFALRGLGLFTEALREPTVPFNGF